MAIESYTNEELIKKLKDYFIFFFARRPLLSLAEGKFRRG